MVIEEHCEGEVTRRYASNVSVDEARTAIAVEQHTTEPAQTAVGELEIS